MEELQHGAFNPIFTQFKGKLLTAFDLTQKPKQKLRLMFIVTVKSIDADSLALPTLYDKTTLQNYNFSMNPQGEEEVSFLSNPIVLHLKLVHQVF